MKKFLLAFLITILPLVGYSADYEVTDEGEIGNSWVVRSNGDIIPKTDSTSDLGASGSEIASGYFDEIYLGALQVDSATIEIFNYALDTGTDGTDYVVTLEPAPSTVPTGMMVLFKAACANGGACSLNVAGAGAAPIKKLHDTDPAANHIEAGSMVLVAYDGTNWQIVDGNDCNP